MPSLWRTVNRKRETRKNFDKNCQLSKPGFTLIETAISLVFILAMIVILLTASGTFRTTRRGNLQGIAAKIASCEIERLRKLGFTQVSTLPSSDSVEPPCNADVTAKLPSGSTTRSISDYDVSGKIKLITVQVNWTESGTAQNIKLETLIAENGL